ncbi:MAG: hypothetical protein IE886_08795 [Campylobacterales bacterium]|nr:hypothetical protein [Campylobacterales bacterium]
MKSASELTDFYYTELYDSLQELEQERHAVRKKLLTLFGILGALSLLIIAFIYDSCRCFNESYLWISVGAAAIGGFGYRMLVSGYRSGFKEKIIRPLIEAIEKELFEPTVFSSLLSIEQAMGYIRTLRSSIGIVEELKLNEKLWSKV